MWVSYKRWVWCSRRRALGVSTRAWPRIWCGKYPIQWLSWPPTSSLSTILNLLKKPYALMISMRGVACFWKGVYLVVANIFLDEYWFIFSRVTLLLCKQNIEKVQFSIILRWNRINMKLIDKKKETYWLFSHFAALNINLIALTR